VAAVAAVGVADLLAGLARRLTHLVADGVAGLATLLTGLIDAGPNVAHERAHQRAHVLGDAPELVIGRH
jgi:hypothetical protein